MEMQSQGQQPRSMQYKFEVGTKGHRPHSLIEMCMRTTLFAS